jgi:hypothetical protein
VGATSDIDDVGDSGDGGRRGLGLVWLLAHVVIMPLTHTFRQYQIFGDCADIGDVDIWSE